MKKVDKKAIKKALSKSPVPTTGIPDENGIAVDSTISLSRLTKAELIAKVQRLQRTKRRLTKQSKRRLTKMMELRRQMKQYEEGNELAVEQLKFESDALQFELDMVTEDREKALTELGRERMKQLEANTRLSSVLEQCEDDDYSIKLPE